MLPPPPSARAVIAEADDRRAVIARAIVRSRPVGHGRRAIAAIAGRGDEIVVVRIVARRAGDRAAHTLRTLALRHAARGVDRRGDHEAVLALIGRGAPA